MNTHKARNIDQMYFFKLSVPRGSRISPILNRSMRIGNYLMALDISLDVIKEYTNAIGGKIIPANDDKFINGRIKQ